MRESLTEVVEDSQTGLQEIVCYVCLQGDEFFNFGHNVSFY